MASFLTNQIGFCRKYPTMLPFDFFSDLMHQFGPHKSHLILPKSNGNPNLPFDVSNRNFAIRSIRNTLNRVYLFFIFHLTLQMTVRYNKWIFLCVYLFDSHTFVRQSFVRWHLSVFVFVVFTLQFPANSPNKHLVII